MDKKTEKQNIKYRLRYICPTDGFITKVTEEREITVDTFDASIPNEFVGYIVLYGSEVTIYNEYCVYKGEILSFKEAKEKFPDAKVIPNITEEMVTNGKSTEELREQFSVAVNLDEKFKSFIKECEEIDFSENEEDCSVIIPEGIVITSTNQLHHIYSTDVVILSKEN